MQLTLIIYGGAGLQEISCPELRFSYNAGERVSRESLETFYNSLVVKCDAILKAGKSALIKNLIPYARLFKDNQETIKANILQRKEILAQVD